ncbi:MAG: PAS domain S-box protein [Arcobacteraceae bacterium]|nr:PAS domain S-box protein [Arcobacteraceae bacterium]
MDQHKAIISILIGLLLSLNILFANNVNDYAPLWQIIVFSLFIIFIILYMNQKLEKRIQKTIKTLEEQNYKLQESVDNFKNLFDTTLEMIVIFKMDGEIIDINQPGVKLSGYTNKTEIIGKNIEEFIFNNDIEKVKKAMQKDISEPYELTMLNKYGKKIYTLRSGRNIIRDGKKLRMSSIVDLTEIKQKDELIQQQSKLALMGEMISMIAHQWRQPLNIIGAINMKVETKLDFEETITAQYYEHVSEGINKQLSYMSKTIDDFRDFFKPSTGKENTNFNKLINSVFSIVRTSIINKNIKIITQLDCDENFDTYASELTQVILSIIKNAQDVLLDKNIKKPYIKLKTYIEKDKYILKIYDNGGGIPDHIINKIFDPYFSTKTEKHGTGLGLYMSKTIIEEHCGGKLTVSNNKDGAVFKILLKR